MAALAGAGTDNQDDQHNYLGIASIANVPASHEDDVLVVLVHNEVGSGIGPFAAGADALDWICTYPLARGRIRVVNMSWGVPRWKFCHDLADSLGPANTGLATFRDACRNAFRAGVNLIASAGNGEVDPPNEACGELADTVLAYPAAFPDYCLAVAALGCRGQLSLNPRFNVGSYIDVAGPGVGADSLGLVPDCDDTYTHTGQGTSPASPVIASAVALLMGAQYNLYPEDCNALLKASAQRYGNDRIEVGSGMPRLDAALEWVTGNRRVFHGSQEAIDSWELVEGWDDPRTVVMKNIPPELCPDGNGEEWQQLDLLAYRVTSVVQIDPPQDGSIEMVWPRGVGSSGWRLLDETLEGYPDPDVPPYYDFNYYENWAHLDEVVGNQYTFSSYTYLIVRDEEDCWVPCDPEGPYNLNYSYVAYDPNMPSAVADLPQSGSLDLTVSSTVVQVGGSIRLTVSLPEPAQLWLGVYGVDGRLVHMFENGGRLGAGTTDVTWDLTGKADRRVAAGVYFVRAKARLTGTGQAVTRARLVVVK